MLNFLQYFKRIFGGYGGLEPAKFEDQILQSHYSLLVIYLTVSVSDFTIVVATSSVGDKSTICQWADGSKADVD